MAKNLANYEAYLYTDLTNLAKWQGVYVDNVFRLWCQVTEGGYLLLERIEPREEPLLHMVDGPLEMRFLEGDATMQLGNSRIDKAPFSKTMVNTTTLIPKARTYFQFKNEGSFFYIKPSEGPCHLIMFSKDFKQDLFTGRPMSSLEKRVVMEEFKSFVA